MTSGRRGREKRKGEAGVGGRNQYPLSVERTARTEGEGISVAIAADTEDGLSQRLLDAIDRKGIFFFFFKICANMGVRCVAGCK